MSLSRIPALRVRLRALLSGVLAGVVAVSCRPAVDPASPGPEVRLVIRTQPSGVQVGAPIATPAVVDVLDRDDMPVAAPNLTVRATIESGTAQIVEGAEVDVVNGVATFSNLTLIGVANTSIRLRFALFDDGAPGEAAPVSATNFTLLAGAPASISAASTVLITGSPDQLANPAPSVTVRDAGQNVLNGIPVTFEIAAGEGRLSGSAQSTTNASGVATVAGWVLGLPGTNQLVASISPTQLVTFTAAVTATAGVLRVRLAGHPAQTAARVRVAKTSASGATYNTLHNVTDSLTVTNLPFGTYAVTGDSMNVGSRIWMPDANFVGLSVSATTGPSVTIDYREHGRIAVTTLGLPSPALPAIVDFVPTGGASALLFAFPVANEEVARGFGPIGSYNAMPRSVTANGQQYLGAPAQQALVIAGGAAETALTVTYTVVTGTLTVVRAGTLPVGAAPMVDVTGPGGFHETVFLSATRSWTGLTPGTYTVVASPITVAAVTYTPSPTNAQRTVTAGAEATLTLTYSQ